MRRFHRPQMTQLKTRHCRFRRAAGVRAAAEVEEVVEEEEEVAGGEA